MPENQVEYIVERKRYRFSYNGNDLGLSQWEQEPNIPHGHISMDHALRAFAIRWDNLAGKGLYQYRISMKKTVYTATTVIQALE